MPWSAAAATATSWRPRSPRPKPRAERTPDARDEAGVAAFLHETEAGAPLEVTVFNVGANVNFPVLDTTERVFRKVWELGPQGIHVAHLVIDSGVDTAWVRARIEARGATGRLEPDRLMNRATIAETYWQLHNQPRDGWTHEMDLRPYGESW